jgi:hypothetical protein
VCRDLAAWESARLGECKKIKRQVREKFWVENTILDDVGVFWIFPERRLQNDDILGSKKKETSEKVTRPEERTWCLRYLIMQFQLGGDYMAVVLTP